MPGLQGGCDGWGEAQPQSLLSPPGQRFHCGGRKKRRWVLGFHLCCLVQSCWTGPGFSPIPPSLSHAAQCNTSPFAFCSTGKGARTSCRCR